MLGNVIRANKTIKPDGSPQDEIERHLRAR